MKSFEVKNYRMFEVTFLGATNYRGSRIKIKEPKRFADDKNPSVVMGYDYAISDTMEQAFQFLTAKGFKIVGRASTADKYIFFTDNWGEDFIEL